MNKEIIINEDIVQISDNIKEIIKKLTLKYTFRISDKEKKELEENIRNYKKISSEINEIISQTYLTVKFKLKNKQDYSFDQKLNQQLIKLCEKYKNICLKENITDNGNYLLLSYFKNNNNLETLVELLNLAYEINSTNYNLFLLRDYEEYKKDCLINMKYFMNEDEIEKFNNEYTNALKEQNIQKLKKILNDINKLILNEWNNYFDDLENMTDEKFCFIGHSTNSEKFDGNFYSKYISCSLYNQEVNDTYRQGFGFILGPNNIIGAETEDMHVNNYTNSDEDICQFSSFPKLYHPTRMLEECKKIKKENPHCNIYNEVLIKEFNPIGIFSFTIGPKELDYNYERALKLKENFPNLKIYSFDKYKTNKNSINKLSLIRKLREKFSTLTFEITADDLDKYNYFFEKYDKIENNCTIEDVQALYKKNEELLSVFEKKPKELFKQYNEQEIKYILKYNCNYNIDDILKRNITPYALTKFQEFYEYKDELDKYYNGIGTLIELVSKIKITEETIEEIKKINPLTIENINNLLNKKLKDITNEKINELETKKDETIKKIEILKNNYEQLSKEYKKAKEAKELYDYYSEINIWELKYIKKDFEELKIDIEKNENNERNSKIKILTYKKKIERLKEQKENNENQVYNDEEEKKLIDELKEEKQKLNKHPLINRRKIKIINKKIENLKTKIVNKQNEYDKKNKEKTEEIDYKIYDIELELTMQNDILKYITNQRKNYQEEMNNIEKKLKQEFNSNTIQEAAILIEKANQFIKNYKYTNLEYLKNEINKIINQYKEESKEILKIDEQIEEMKNKGL